MRIRTQSLSSSGNIQFPVTYTKFAASGTCGGSGSNINGTVTQNFGSSSLQVIVNSGESIQLTAPSPEDGQDFVDWTSPDGGTFTTSGTGNRTICVTGSSDANDFEANYTTDHTAPKVSSINRATLHRLAPTPSAGR